MSNLSVFNIIKKDGLSYNSFAETEGTTSIYTFEFCWTDKNVQQNDTIDISWSVPQNDLLYKWTPNCFLDRSLPTNYSSLNKSMISYSAPMTVLFNGKSEHKYSWAISECSKLVYYRTGVRENDGRIYIHIKIPVNQYTNSFNTTFKIRIDEETKDFSKSVKQIAKWWESELKGSVFSTPDFAKDALYSFWYSYHRDFNAEIIEKECEEAAKLGFKVTIIDDGWQTNNREWEGYSICGDWNVGNTKIPNMKRHVENIHKLGMKYILWYSVPFMGEKCSVFPEFKDMLLRKFRENVYLLDPRYKTVRDFLINIYTTAVIEWNLDGLKLDFVDKWCEDEENAPYSPEMDIPALQDAVDTLMSDIAYELKKIKSDILIEFRQNYIGPNMRKFGNMFRVTDCPNDYLKNRVGVLDLRLMMENSAVHSDMLMWHENEKPEIFALQIINILFGTMQYSAKIKETNNENIKVTRFWMDFMREHKELLLNSELTVFEPQLLYTWAKTSSENECAVAVYSTDKCIRPDFKNTIYIANGCESEQIFVKLEDNYSVRIFNCMGEGIPLNITLNQGVNALRIPVGGLAILNII